MTCKDAIKEVFADNVGVLSTRDVIDRVYARHPDRPWAENTIQAHLIALSVNHPSSRHHRSTRKHAFLFSLGNGRFRRWNPAQDGTWELTEDGVKLVDPEEKAPTEEYVEELEAAAAADTSLSLERDLEAALVASLDQIEPGLQLYDKGGLLGRQLDTGAVGRLDILAVDPEGNLVVLELKAGRADDRACGQILRYMGWVKENLAGDANVRGIIVAHQFTDALKYAAKAVPAVTLKSYEIHFEFNDV